MTDRTDPTRAVLFIAGATAWAVSGYVTTVLEDPDVEFRAVKFAKTIGIGVVAGLVMVSAGDEFNEAAFDAAVMIAVPIVDRLTNTAAALYASTS